MRLKQWWLIWPRNENNKRVEIFQNLKIFTSLNKYVEVEPPSVYLHLWFLFVFEKGNCWAPVVNSSSQESTEHWKSEGGGKNMAAWVVWQ